MIFSNVKLLDENFQVRQNMFVQTKDEKISYIGEKMPEKKSAAATAIGILNYAPDCIISQGTAGGHDPQLHKKDIVVGERLINISSFQTCSARKYLKFLCNQDNLIYAQLVRNFDFFPRINHSKCFSPLL